jgi:hypothetical protein
MQRSRAIGIYLLLISIAFVFAATNLQKFNSIATIPEESSNITIDITAEDLLDEENKPIFLEETTISYEMGQIEEDVEYSDVAQYDTASYNTYVEGKGTYIGKYSVTWYCGCPQCCGSWAYNRPKDENGNDIVVGAAGVPLIAGYSVASTLPFGTKLYVEGYGYVEVMERGVGYGRLDLYFANTTNNEQ